MVDGEAAAVPAEALAEAKAYLRVDGAGEDASISALMSAAAAVCEAFGGVTLSTRAFEEAIDGGGAWVRLARTPVREIAGVVGADGVALPPTAFASAIDRHGDGWVRLTTGSAAGSARVRVRYRAGLADKWNDLPAPLTGGVVRLAAHLRAGRDGANDGPPPAAVTALWRPYRRVRLR